MDTGSEEPEGGELERGADLADAEGPEGPSRLTYTPLFRAQHDARYRRQSLIRNYERQYECNLVVMIDQITQDSVTYLAECFHNIDGDRDLHLMLCSPGGDPETAIRLIRMGQAAGKRLVIVVPEQAKSAATIMCLGAHEVVMGPTSDLGPIDPQIFAGERGFVSAKDLIAAIDDAEQKVARTPDVFPILAAMLGGIDATMVQFARSALDRTGDIARQAIASNPDRSGEEIDALCQSIHGPLIDTPKMHGALVGATEAEAAGLNVTQLPPNTPHWAAIWTLWTQYFALGPVSRMRVYEGRIASQVQNL